MKEISEDEVAILLVLHIQGRINPSQREVLEAWRNASPGNEKKFNELTNAGLLRQKLNRYSALVENEGSKLKHLFPEKKPLYWIRYAAAAVLLIGVFLFINRKPQKETQQVVVKIRQTDPPQKSSENSAVLVLADGTTIVLDSVNNGRLARQEGIEILKTSDGHVKYQLQGNMPADVTALNTMYSPRGRKVKLSLPDGSQVWLNAASSITFPPVFGTKERMISVKGEAYFEIARDAQRPFRVNINNKGIVDVLGTNFNINAYDDEPFIRTTLVEGRVKVAYGISSEILEPGEQATMNPGGRLQVDEDVNIEQVIAWTKDKLAFTGTDFKGMMRQISRWYDVDVVFAGSVPDLRIGGFMRRDVNITTVLDFLKGNGVKYEFDGKVITIY